MSNGVRVAAAVGAGYVLGRTRKMRLAFMLAAAGVTGKFPARPSDLVVQGLKSLGASEQFNELGDQLRGELLGAARAAAVAAATSQVDALNDRLQGVTSQVGADETLKSVGGATDKVGGRVASRAGMRRKATPEPEDADDYEDENADAFDDLDDEEIDEVQDVGDDEVEEPEPPVRRRSTMRQAAPAKTAARRSVRAEAHDEPRARASRRRSTAAGAPVRRGR